MGTLVQLIDTQSISTFQNQARKDRQGQIDYFVNTAIWFQFYRDLWVLLNHTQVNYIQLHNIASIQ